MVYKFSTVQFFIKILDQVYPLMFGAKPDKLL